MGIRKFEYRLYPNKKHIHRLEEQLRKGTEVYNRLLTIYKEEFLENEIKLGRYDLEYYITLMRRENPQYRSMYRITLNCLAKRLAWGLKYYFKKMAEWKEGKCKKPGMPRYKKSIRSIEFAAMSVKVLDRDKVKIGRIGNVKAVLHRELIGEVKEVTVLRKASGKWFIIFTCDQGDETMPRADGREVGIDMGLIHFATFSDGNVVENPHFLLKAERRIRRLQKDLARKKKGSNNRKRSKLMLATAYERLENQRNAFLHKVSRDVVNNYSYIAVESLGITRMIIGQSTAKAILDVSWYKFMRMLEYKASSAGAQLVYIDTYSPTSKKCSECGEIRHIRLDERTFICPNCGLNLDRDSTLRGISSS
jgi:putative transposase